MESRIYHICTLHTLYIPLGFRIGEHFMESCKNVSIYLHLTNRLRMCVQFVSNFSRLILRVILSGISDAYSKKVV